MRLSAVFCELPSLKDAKGTRFSMHRPVGSEEPKMRRGGKLFCDGYTEKCPLDWLSCSLYNGYT